MMSIKDSVIGAIVGAFCTVAVGAIFSSATLNFVTGVFSRSILPPNAIIFVNSAECPAPWIKPPGMEGRYIVTAGRFEGFEFPAGNSGGRTKITLLKENLPPFQIVSKYFTTDIDFHGGPFRVVRDINSGSRGQLEEPGTLHINFENDHQQEIELNPTWYALTPCSR